MDFIRRGFDKLYDAIKPAVFDRTQKDHKKAHELFVSACKSMRALRLEKLILNNRSNNLDPGFELSNAAGLNKNGNIPPTVLQYMGFDRVVVGTVTYDQWDGNPRPTVRRYPESGDTFTYTS